MRWRALAVGLVVLAQASIGDAQPAPNHALHPLAPYAPEREPDPDSPAEARSDLPAAAKARESEPDTPRSEDRAETAKILCGLGAVLALTGAGATAVGWSDIDAYVLYYTLPVMGGGAVLGAIGAALWASASTTAPALSTSTRPRGRSRDDALPRVAIAPRAATLHWRF